MQDIKLIKADTCSPEDTVSTIAKKMKSKKIRRFFVIDKAGKLLGVVTTVDIINKIVATNKNPSKTKVKDVMTKNIQAISTEENLDDCLKIMNDLKTFVCPVVEKGKLLGVVSYQNIIASVVHGARK